MQPMEMGEMEYSIPNESLNYTNRPLSHSNQPLNQIDTNEQEGNEDEVNSLLKAFPLHTLANNDRHSSNAIPNNDIISLLLFNQDKETINSAIITTATTSSSNNNCIFPSGESDKVNDNDNVDRELWPRIHVKAVEHDVISTLISSSNRNKDIFRSEHEYEHNLDTRQESFYSSLYDDASQQHDTGNSQKEDIHRRTNELVSATKLESMSNVSLQELSRLENYS